MLLSQGNKRYGRFLRQRYRAILGYTGLVSTIAGVVILSPLLALFAYPEELSLAWGFALPGLILAAIGGLLWWRLAPKQSASLTLQEGAVIVVLSWLLAIAVVF